MLPLPSSLLFINSSRIQCLSTIDCTATCAQDAVDTYEKESKDADKCDKSCDKEDDECKDACKAEEEEIEKEAHKKAEGEYGKCNDECFDGSSFKLGYVA